MAPTDGSIQEGVSSVNQFCSEETARGWQRIDNAGNNKKGEGRIVSETVRTGADAGL